VILHELLGTESHPQYRALEIANGGRLYDFLNSAITVSIAVQRGYLSSALLKAFNFHAIACLHTNAGEYRPCGVTVGTHIPIDHWRVNAHMEDFINYVNFNWGAIDAVTLAAYALWQLNYIHPFINGNGRTSRAACYFVLCVKSGGPLTGKTILPELLVRERARYCKALADVDASLMNGAFDLSPVHGLVSELLQEQLQS
jgi:hypothetical protein